MCPEESTGPAAVSAAKGAGESAPAVRPDAATSSRDTTAAGPDRTTRFGIKFKLFAAFAVLVALMIVAGSVAWWIFHDMHRSLNRVAHKDMLSLVEAVALSEVVGRITVTNAALNESANDDERERELAVLRQLEQDFSASLERLREVADHEAEMAELKSAAARLSGELGAVDATVEKGLRLTAMRQQAEVRLDKVHDSLMGAIDTRVDAILSALKDARVTRQDTETLAGLIHLRRVAEHALDVLREGVAAQTPGQVSLHQDRFADAASHLTDALAGLPKEVRADQVQDALESIADLGSGQQAILPLRERELAVRDKAVSNLDTLRTEEVAFDQALSRLVQSIHRGSDQSAERAGELIKRGETAMIGLTLASAVIVLGVMLLYVGRRIIRPLEAITGAMTELAGGDTTVDVPCRSRGDELGRMAQALGVFRDTAIEVQESNLREIHAARQRLADAIESISEAFSLYDAEDRLVICNEKYHSLLYSGLTDEVVPGKAFAAIIRSAAEKGLVRDAVGRIDDWVEERMARHRDPGAPFLHQRGDGRWILVSERRTRDGGTVAVYSDITDLKEREQELAEKSMALEQLSNQLSKYLSPQVYESIFSGRQEVKLTSHRKKLTVFFSDIAAFTETTDRMESEELTALLNHYLSEMAQIALAHGATIDKYIGDAILIFFGDPESRGVGEDALACMRMAIAMQRRMGELEQVWRASGIGQPLKCRMGVGTGYCTVGNFGSEDRFDYTIIGGTVNLASRLETAAQPGEILLSYETYALVHHEIPCEELPPLTVKGLPYPIRPYRVIASREESDDGAGRIAERSGNMTLELNAEAMSDDERAHAAELLRTVLRRIARGR